VLLSLNWRPTTMPRTPGDPAVPRTSLER
jgi:hypothetical protein